MMNKFTTSVAAEAEINPNLSVIMQEAATPKLGIPAVKSFTKQTDSGIAEDNTVISEAEIPAATEVTLKTDSANARMTAIRV